MDFECQDRISFPAEDVFHQAADGLAELAAWLPDVERVEALSSRRVARGVVERVDRWTAEARRAGSQPAATWLVTSRWDGSRLTADWHIDALHPRDGASCEGTVTFEPRGSAATAVTVAWNINLMGYALPLPTRALAIAFAPHAERAVGEVVERNVAAMLGGIEGCLASTATLRRAS